MTARRLVHEAIVIGFLAATLAGFVYTLFGLRLPLVPRALRYLSYSAMAPYQGDTPRNAALFAEGKTADGSWKEIDLQPYYPFARGRQDIRMFLLGDLRQVAREPQDVREQYLRMRYASLAQLLLSQERERGNSYDAVRLSWETWPLSPLGHDALYSSPSRTREQIAQYP